MGAAKVYGPKSEYKDGLTGNYEPDTVKKSGPGQCLYLCYTLGPNCIFSFKSTLILLSKVLFQLCKVILKENCGKMYWVMICKV